MILTHAGHAPSIDPDAWIAPNAVVCGNVTIGPGARIAWGAQVIAEGGAIRIGSGTVVLENAVLRSTPLHDLAIGDHCVVGPNTHVAGCTVESGVFIATGASVFHAAHLGAGA
jgi:carbonic anhydrase/acetyltransferase-like protein (isoleucine patch superfamily)